VEKWLLEPESFSVLLLLFARYDSGKKRVRTNFRQEEKGAIYSRTGSISSIKIPSDEKPPAEKFHGNNRSENISPFVPNANSVMKVNLIKGGNAIHKRPQGHTHFAWQVGVC